MADQVTTFTASEFGRTLFERQRLGPRLGRTSPGAWRRGAGGRCYGAHPDIALDGPGFVDNGRLLPDMAVEQLGAEPGAWFGAGRDELALAFPNLSRSAGGPAARARQGRLGQIDHSPPAIRRSLSTRRFQRAASLSTNRASSDEPRRTSAPCSAILAATPASASA